MTAEDQLQIALLKRFRILHKEKHPNCKVISNPFSSFKMDVIKMRIAKILGFEASQPDLLFLQPNSKYIGLALEIKTIKGNPYLKDGVTLKKNTHLENQQKYLKELESVGYYATFGVGFEHCAKIIDKYFEIV